MTDVVGGAGDMGGTGSAVAREPAEAPVSSSEAVPADRDILHALTRGDQRLALALCVERHGASIGRLCMAMLGSQVDADDVTQETLLTAHEAFRDYRGEGSVRAWLLGIARNRCLKHLEKHRRRGARLALVADAEAALHGAGEAGAAHSSARAGHEPGTRRGEEARALLSRLKPSDRDVLILRYCAGLSFREVAEACGIAEAAARKRVSRAILALKMALEEEAKHE